MHVCLHIVLLSGRTAEMFKLLPLQSSSLLIPFNHFDWADQSQHLPTLWATKEFHSPHATSQKHEVSKGTYRSHFIYFSRALPSPSLRHWGWRVSFAFIWWVFHLSDWPHWQSFSWSQPTQVFLGFQLVFLNVSPAHTHMNKWEGIGEHRALSFTHRKHLGTLH